MIAERLYLARNAGRSRTLVAALAAVVLLGGLLLFLALRGGPGAGPRGGEQAGRDGAASAPAGKLAGDASGVTKDAAPEAATEAEESPPPEPPGPPLLRGRVTGEGEGIAGARVRLFPVKRVEASIDRLVDLGTSSGGFPDVAAILGALREELEAIRRSDVMASTDGTGAYEVRQAKPGDYLVLTTAGGWLLHFGDVVSLAEGETRVLEVRLDRGVSIAGRVIDRSSAGIPGVKVTAEYRPAGVTGAGILIRRLLRYVNGEYLSGPFETTTAADGSFRLGSLPPGLYDLAAEKPGAPEGRLKGVETGAAEAVVFLGKGGSLHAVLHDAGDEVIEDLPARLERQDDIVQLPLPMAGMSGVANSLNRLLGDGPLTVRSGKGGELRFGPLAGGSYRLSIGEPGFLPFVRVFDVGLDEDLDLGTLTIDRGEAITGTVRSEDGAALEGARVTASPAEMNFFNMGNAMDDLFTGRTTALSDASGSFRLAGLPRGKHRLSAILRGYAPAKQQEVRTGGKPVELVLRPGARVTGRVVEAGDDRNPIGGVKVTAGGVKAETGADGLFVLEGVVPESPDANPFIGMAGPSGQPGGPPPSTQVKVSASLRGYLQEETEVDLLGGDVEVEIALRKTPGVSGVVLDPEGKPASGALVRLIPAMKANDMPPGFDFFDRGMVFLAATVSDGEGKFRLRDFRGADSGQAFQVIADHPLHARGTSEELHLAADDEAPVEVEVRLGAPGKVKGTVSDGRSLVPGALVRLRKAPKAKKKEGFDAEEMMVGMLGLPKGGDTTYTTSDGAFAFERVLAGDYAISAEKGGFAESAAQTFSLGAGGTQEVALTVDPGGEIAGEVRDPRGEPIDGARIRLFTDSPEDTVEGKSMREAQKMFGASYRTARSGEDGAFLLTGLPAGRYTVRAEREGFTAGEVAGVSPGERKKLTLEPAAGLRGAVADAASRAAITSFQVKFKKEVRPVIPGAAGDVVIVDSPFEDQAFGGQGRPFNDAEGRFLREDLESGGYLVTVTAHGYLPSERKVVLKSGAVVEEEFLLAQAGRVRGVVRDVLTGRPIAGARVGLARGPAVEAPVAEGQPDGGEKRARKVKRVVKKEEGAAESPAEAAPPDPVQEDALAMGEYFQDEWMGGAERTSSGDDGSFVLEGIPPGPQRLAVTHPLYLSETRDGIEVSPGQELSIDFGLRKGFSISGRVLDGQDKPAPGKMVFIRGAGEDNARARRSAMTGDGGAFRVDGLAPGSYRVILPQSMSVSSSDKVDAQARKKMEPVIVELDRDVEGLEVRLPEGGE